MENGLDAAKPFRHILFPTDFSKPVIRMVPYVMEIACRFNASVTVLHAFNVVHDYNLASAATHEFERVEIPYTAGLEVLRSRRQNQLDEFANAYFSGLHHAVRLEDGDPATIIEQVAQKDHVDLIAMPTRGLGKFRRFLLGSVTEKVLHDVNCALLSDAHDSDPAGIATRGFRSIVCAVELNAQAVSVLNTAASLAEAYRATLCLVHTLESMSAQAESATMSIKEAWLADGGGTGVRAKVRVLDAGVPEGVRQAAIEEGADLVVVGRGHESGTFSRVWSDLYAIICTSPCPVLSVSAIPSNQ